MLTVIILAAIWGLVVGALARLALPGPDPMPWWQTILLGLAGSFVGGILGKLIFGSGAGIFLSVIGAVILLALHRKYVQKRPVFRA
jgi:uncharacterized membrane protein YeaQ/YmgE (transglycosylase-associated protein family)